MRPGRTVPRARKRDIVHQRPKFRFHAGTLVQKIREPASPPLRLNLLDPLQPSTERGASSTLPAARSTRTCWMPRCWPTCSPLVCSPEKVTCAVPSSSHARSGSMPPDAVDGDAVAPLAGRVRCGEDNAPARGHRDGDDDVEDAVAVADVRRPDATAGGHLVHRGLLGPGRYVADVRPVTRLVLR